MSAWAHQGRPQRAAHRGAPAVAVDMRLPPVRLARTAADVILPPRPPRCPCPPSPATYPRAPAPPPLLSSCPLAPLIKPKLFARASAPSPPRAAPRRYKEEIEQQKGEGCHVWGELNINKVGLSSCLAEQRPFGLVWAGAGVLPRVGELDINKAQRWC